MMQMPQWKFNSGGATNNSGTETNRYKLVNAKQGGREELIRKSQRQERAGSLCLNRYKRTLMPADGS